MTLHTDEPMGFIIIGKKPTEKYTYVQGPTIQSTLDRAKRMVATFKADEIHEGAPVKTDFQICALVPVTA